MFNNFPTYISALTGTDNDSILQATQGILEMHTQPGFLEYLIQFLVNNNSDPKIQYLTITVIKNNIKMYWENENLYSNKVEIRNMMLKILLMSPAQFVPLLCESINIIASHDFPERWPDLMLNMTNALENPTPQSMYAIILTAKTIFQRFDHQMESPSLFNQINKSIEYWDKNAYTLLLQLLPQLPPSPLVEECFINVLSIIYSLNSHGMTPIYQERINEFFDCYNHFLSLPPDQFIRGKTQICLNVKQCVIRYLYEIHVWGTTEDYKQEPEVIQHMRETFGNIFKNILNTFQSNDENLTIAAFDALKQLARSSDKNFFVDNEILISLCQSVLIPCIQLDPEDVNSFDSEPLKYFAKDIDGVEGSKRNNAYDFLKTLCRNFRQQLQMVFIPYSNDLLQKYQADPLNNWVQMDTAIFIMGAIATETQLVRQGVTKVAEGFDLEGFVNQFIIPQLNPQNQFPILQTDSLKFIVDFRSILKPIIPNIFVIVQNLLLSSQSPAVTFYSAYCMERLMFSQSNDPEVLNVMMTQVNLQAIVNRLFEIFVYDKELNVQASKCLMRIVTTGHPNVIPLIPFIIKTTTDYIRRLCGNPLNPNFTHCLFEILVASVTRLNVDVKLIEPPVLDLLNVIISENVTDFVPYVFQIIGTYLLSYPPNVEVNPFYATQFEFFLNPQLWQPQGNVPALSILVRAYIIRIPELVANFSSQILFICQGLLQMPRAHKYAFEIFENIFRFMEHNGSVNLFRQIQPLIIQQIGNPDLVQFQQSFSVFMAKAAYYLGADEFLSNLNPMPDFIEAWGKALSIMRGREYLKCILAGVLKVLLEATIIPPELWEHLFISLLMMFEAPSDDYYKEMHQSSKQATVEAMEFDTTFNKLVYSDIPQLKEFQELDGADLVKFMYVNLAGWSQSHPGVIQAIVQNKLPPKIQSTFVSYCKSYEIQFY